VVEGRSGVEGDERGAVHAAPDDVPTATPQTGQDDENTQPGNAERQADAVGDAVGDFLAEVSLGKGVCGALAVMVHSANPSVVSKIRFGIAFLQAALQAAQANIPGRRRCDKVVRAGARGGLICVPGHNNLGGEVGTFRGKER